MPVSRAARTDAEPDRLRSYTFHGTALALRGGQAVGDCPFCGCEGNFSVEVATGRWRCWVCGGGQASGGGNPLIFLRLLHEQAAAAAPAGHSGAGAPGRRPDGRSPAQGGPDATCAVLGGPAAFPAAVARDRRLLDAATPVAWGVAPAADGSWLVPGYSAEGRLDQLYRRTRLQDREEWVWRLLPTPGVWPEGKVHALHLPRDDFDPSRRDIVVCEGPWDGMALWEVWGRDGDVNIVAVPGCNVWRDEWSALCRGKRVTIMFDSDHPRQYVPGRTSRAGRDGAERVAKRLSGIAASVHWLRWGEDGYDPTRPSGWDVRDHLTESAGDLEQRRAALSALILKVQPVPVEWCASHLSNGAASRSGPANVEPDHCDAWRKCEAAWREALEWRCDLSDVLSVMLAVAASTDRAGDNQLFLQVIGDPGSAKTRMCKGLLVSARCKLILHLKSFHSGWRGEDGKDCSLVSRINGLCLVTPEADALSLGLSWEQLNSQMRQIFDGDSGHTYGNSSDDVHYRGLRSPWIQAGTPALMDKDQSRLGDRFLRVRIGEPTEQTKQAILLRSLRNERAAVLETSNGTEASIISPKLRRAYALTGGYVDWLRANVEEQICSVEMDGTAEQWCVDLAILTADMRARPNMDPKKHEVHHSKELPSRLVGQFGRLALCLAVVQNKRSVDAEVLRIVRKVALDTAHGHSLNIAQWLCSPNPKAGDRSYQDCGGLAEGTLSVWTGMTSERLTNYLVFLRKIDVLELRATHGKGAWVLTPRALDLYLRIAGGQL